MPHGLLLPPPVVRRPDNWYVVVSFVEYFLPLLDRLLVQFCPSHILCHTSDWPDSASTLSEVIFHYQFTQPKNPSVPVWDDDPRDRERSDLASELSANRYSLAPGDGCCCCSSWCDPKNFFQNRGLSRPFISRTDNIHTPCSSLRLGIFCDFRKFLDTWTYRVV